MPHTANLPEPKSVDALQGATREELLARLAKASFVTGDNCIESFDAGEEAMTRHGKTPVLDLFLRVDTPDGQRSGVTLEVRSKTDRTIAYRLDLAIVVYRVTTEAQTEIDSTKMQEHAVKFAPIESKAVYAFEVRDPPGVRRDPTGGPKMPEAQRAGGAEGSSWHGASMPGGSRSEVGELVGVRGSRQEV